MQLSVWMSGLSSKSKMELSTFHLNTIPTLAALSLKTYSFFRPVTLHILDSSSPSLFTSCLVRRHVLSILPVCGVGHIRPSSHNIWILNRLAQPQSFWLPSPHLTLSCPFNLSKLLEVVLFVAFLSQKLPVAPRCSSQVAEAACLTDGHGIRLLALVSQLRVFTGSAFNSSCIFP